MEITVRDVVCNCVMGTMGWDDEMLHWLVTSWSKHEIKLLLSKNVISKVVARNKH